MSAADKEIAKDRIKRVLTDLGKSASDKAVDKMVAFFKTKHVHRNNIQDFLRYFKRCEVEPVEDGGQQVDEIDDKSNFLEQLIKVAEMDNGFEKFNHVREAFVKALRDERGVVYNITLKRFADKRKEEEAPAKRWADAVAGGEPEAEAEAEADRLGRQDQGLPEGTRICVAGHGRGAYVRFERQRIGANEHTIAFDSGKTIALRLKKEAWTVKEHEMGALEPEPEQEPEQEPEPQPQPGAEEEAEEHEVD